jgi:hypothetical protein
MKEWEIWAESYQDMCSEPTGPQLLGKAMGETFAQACESFFSVLPTEGPYKGQQLFENRNGRLMYWSMDLFPTRAEAEAAG